MNEISIEQKEAFFSILKNKGFVAVRNGGTYIFSNKETNSYTKFTKVLGLPESMEEYPCLKEFDYLWMKGKFPDHLLKELTKDYSTETNANLPNLPENFLEESPAHRLEINDYIKSLVPVINIGKTTDPLILLDPAKDCAPVTDLDGELYPTIVGRPLKSLITDESVMKVLTCFDPYTLKSLFVRPSKNQGLNVYHVNYYVAPSWRFVDAKPRFGGFIKKLIDHLFPIEFEKEYVLDWLHYAIAKRNETVLCLIGPRGTGKGLLLKDILGVLIGEKYREIVNQEILTDKFNGAFKNRRYIFFDEVNVSGDRELNKFKAFCNSHIALEEKGQDSETIENYTSLALSSNDKKDFKAEPQERRFSVPEITQTPFLEVVSEKEIEEFVLRIGQADSIEIAEFGQFLLERKPKNSSRKPLKGKYFFELCKLSMPEWKTYIIDYLIHEAEVGVPILNSTLTKKFKKIHGEDAPFATKRGSIDSFLMDYFHEGVCRIGEVVDAWDSQRSRDTFAILPNPEFLKKFGKNNPVYENPTDAL